MRPAQGGVGSTDRDRLPGQPRRQRARQPELPEPHRSRPAGTRPGAERDRRSRRTRTIRGASSPRRTTTGAATATATSYYSSDDGRTLAGLDAADELHPRRRRSAASRASTGRPAATPRWPGTRRATRTCRARCSCAATAVSNNPDQSSAFYVFRSTGNGGASWNFPARPVAELNDVAGAGDALLDKQYMTIDDHEGQPVPGPHLRDLDAVRRRRHVLHLRGLLARLRRELQHAEARQHDERAVQQHARRADAAGHAATRTSSRSRSPGPDGALYVVWDNFNLTGVRPRRGRRRRRRRRRRPRGGAAPRRRQPRTRCCSPSRPTAATRSRRR